jgi:SAM-dependent methyltransferase
VSDAGDASDASDACDSIRAGDAGKAWYEDFFRGVVVDIWRAAVAPEQTRLEADFLESHLRLSRGQRVLDVPCGHGRHAVELARRGQLVTGVDVSDAMLAEARRLAAAHGCRIEWVHGDMRSLPQGADFDAAYCLGNSFGYLDRHGTARFLAAIAGALKPGARFAFDYGTAAESILPRFVAREWAPLDGQHFLEENRYDVERSCIETTYTFVTGGNVETRTGLQWVFTAGEVRALLDSAGFDVLSAQGGIDGRPYALGGTLLMVVAERR